MSKQLTRDEAIAMVGLENVEAVEAVNCEPTSRAYDHKDGEIEWSGSAKVDYSKLSDVQVRKLPVGGSRITAYYYTSAEDSQAVEDVGGDWGCLNWEANHYRID